MLGSVMEGESLPKSLSLLDAEMTVDLECESRLTAFTGLLLAAGMVCIAHLQIGLADCSRLAKREDAR